MFRRKCISENDITDPNWNKHRYWRFEYRREIKAPATHHVCLSNHSSWFLLTGPDFFHAHFPETRTMKTSGLNFCLNKQQKKSADTPSSPLRERCCPKCGLGMRPRTRWQGDQPLGGSFYTKDSWRKVTSALTLTWGHIRTFSLDRGSVQREGWGNGVWFWLGSLSLRGLWLSWPPKTT